MATRNGVGHGGAGPPIEERRMGTVIQEKILVADVRVRRAATGR
jgi:hypothetical protein